MNPYHSNLWFILIDSDRKFGLDQSELRFTRIDLDWKLGFGLIRIHSDWCLGIGLSRIDFWPFFIKRDIKRFSDWFGIIRIGSDTDIGMNRNSSYWLGMNFNPILSPGMLPKFWISVWKLIKERVQQFRLICSLINCHFVLWQHFTLERKKGSSFISKT